MKEYFIPKLELLLKINYHITNVVLEKDIVLSIVLLKCLKMKIRIR